VLADEHTAGWAAALPAVADCDLPPPKDSIEFGQPEPTGPLPVSCADRPHLQANADQDAAEAHSGGRQNPTPHWEVLRSDWLKACPFDWRVKQDLHSARRGGASVMNVQDAKRLPNRRIQTVEDKTQHLHSPAAAWHSCSHASTS
jgi:hypothetical protein